MDQLHLLLLVLDGLELFGAMVGEQLVDSSEILGNLGMGGQYGAHHLIMLVQGEPCGDTGDCLEPGGRQGAYPVQYQGKDLSDLSQCITGQWHL